MDHLHIYILLCTVLCGHDNTGCVMRIQNNSNEKKH